MEFKQFEQEKIKDIELRNRMIEENLRLVYYIVKQFQNVKMEKEDLIQIGTIGLIKSIDTFDTDKNIIFATYATKCITNEILLYLRKRRSEISCISLEQPILGNSDDSLKLIDILCDFDKDLFDRIEEECTREELSEAIFSLNDRERLVILLYFGFYHDKCYNQSEIGEMIGVSQSFASRIIKGSLKKLKERIRLIESMEDISYESETILKKEKSLSLLYKN